ncbi:gamma-interferon-inducible-lysosomal thiol reductase-like isoform X2 [Epargyreus clarus]
MGLIMWQLYRLFNNPPISEPNLSVGDIVELEDDKFNKHKVDKLKVRVYYEALCPDSKYFFIKHLRPVTEKLSEFINVTLVPYGKASTEEINGQYYFKCQHGEEECYANKIHACSIDIIGDMVKSVQFTECMIVDNMDADKALARCAKKMKVNPEPISNCSVNERGSALLKKHGDDTNILKPHFIPTITINGSKENQGAILKNFLLQICKMIDMPLPPPCL